jgi:hypothetical protein
VRSQKSGEAIQLIAISDSPEFFKIFHGNFENNEQQSNELYWPRKNHFPMAKNRGSANATMLDVKRIVL